jgi:predicted TIM-barrel fold metal-dependent hydrolase
MKNDFNVIDAHMHLFSRVVYQRESKKLEKASERYRNGYATWKEGFKKRFNSPFADDPGGDNEYLADQWERELNEACVAKACFIATSPDVIDLATFVSYKPDRFFAIASVDPHDPGSPLALREAVVKHGYRGLKLYPTTGHFSLADKSLYPIYEEADSLGIPVIAHVGITMAFDADMRYSDPSPLHSAARDFPNTIFIVPHFAAGYFRELLFLGYHAPNIYVDTSGTNRWIDYSIESLDLRKVFEKTISVFGAERILFGTDSRLLSQGYRKNILIQQLEIMNELNLSKEQMSMILAGNAERVYRIPT